MIRAADDYVRIIIRRPHAYIFLRELYANRRGVKFDTPQGGTLADGIVVPLPGIYVLNADGKVQASSAISKPELLKALGAGSQPDQDGD